MYLRSSSDPESPPPRGAADEASHNILEVAVEVRRGELDGRERSGVDDVGARFLPRPLQDGRSTTPEVARFVHGLPRAAVVVLLLADRVDGRRRD